MSLDLVKTYCVVTILFCVFSSSSQNSGFTFKKTYEKSISLQKDSINYYSQQTKKTDLALLLTKKTWKISDLTYIDSLVASEKTSQSQIKGLYEYVAGNAFSNFDDDLGLKYYQQAYNSFNSQNDIEGMFFSLSKIFYLKIKTVNENINQHELNQSFKELEQLAANTDYIPVTLALKDIFLRKELSLDAKLKEDILRNISILAEQHKSNYSDLTRNLMTTIGVAYQRLGKLNMSLKFNHKALALSNPLAKDYPFYLINVGKLSFYKNNVDSALYYFKKAYHKIPKKPKDVYSTSLKTNAAFNLGQLYKKTKNKDSAYFFSNESNKYNKLLLNLKLEQNNFYADKKFKSQKAKLKLAKKGLELKEDKHSKRLFTIGLAFIATIISFLIYIYYKVNEQRKEAIEKLNNRKRLLQIVNHDLSEPLQVFIDSYVIIPKLIDSKKYKELELIQNSLSDTLISLQSILKNLFSWNKKNSKNETEAISEIDINKELKRILKSYEKVAAIKTITFDFQCFDEIILKTNAFELGNLLRNIIYNAIKHSPDEKVIHIKAQFNVNKDIVFECFNTIKSTGIEDVKELTNHLNGVKSINYSKTGLGLELIDDALKSLNAQVQAIIEENTFKVKLIIPHLS